jgi:hypothetical protein
MIYISKTLENREVSTNIMYEKFSLSTSWAGDKFQNGDQLVEKYLSLGFKKIELNYSITDQMFNEVLPYVKAGKVEVTSVHHPFPKHYDEEYDTDSIMLGFLDEEKRKKAVDMTKTSIDYANRIGAKVVVIHPSEVPVSDERHYDRLLKNLYKEGKRNTQEYKKLYEEMMDHRGDSSVYVDKVVESLHVLWDYIDVYLIHCQFIILHKYLLSMYLFLQNHYKAASNISAPLMTLSSSAPAPISRTFT